VALSYNVDCFKDISGNSTTSIIIIRNIMGFAMSYGITPWYTNMGLQNCFIMAGFLSLACTGTFLIMIWKGKALRRWSAPKYWEYAAKAKAFQH
jgi:high-affinity Fe2+/Pb2+ permease